MMLKKICYSAFIAFWASLGTVLALHSLAEENTTSNTLKQFTLAQVAEHKTPQDCWMAIDNKIYNLTDYLSKHPAPPSIMIPWCGKDATEGMRTKGYGRDHSPMAWDLLTNYLIGDLES